MTPRGITTVLPLTSKVTASPTRSTSESSVRVCVFCCVPLCFYSSFPSFRVKCTYLCFVVSPCVSILLSLPSESSVRVYVLLWCPVFLFFVPFLHRQECWLVLLFFVPFIFFGWDINSVKQLYSEGMRYIY